MYVYFCSFIKTDHHRLLIHVTTMSSAVLTDYLIDISDKTRKWNSTQERHNLPAVFFCVTVYIITVS